MNQENVREMIILYHEHLDVNWARCADRTIRANQIRVKSYYDVFRWIMDELPALCERGFHYSEGQTYFYRTLKERSKDTWEKVRKLIDNNGIEVLRQGEVICDSTSVPAESIARNFLIADRFYKENCAGNSGTDLGFLWDAFGNSANMPQILKLAGAKYVGGTKYRMCEDHYWVGIDGTAIPCIDRLLGSVHHVEDPMYYKLSRHPECPVCRGEGCPECGYRGMVNAHPFEKEEIKAFLRGTLEIRDKKFVFIGGEESIPGSAVMDAVDELNDELQGQVHFRFGTFGEFWNAHRDFYESVREQYQEPGEELNPVNAGCYVTRIRKKQRLHAVANALIRAESRLACEHWRQGVTAAVTKEFTRAWRDIALNLQHDAIGGAQTDTGCRECMSYLDEAASVADQYVNIGARFCANRADEDHSLDGVRRVRLGKLDVTYDLKGIISACKDGVDVFGEYRIRNQGYTGTDSAPLRIGELVLQEDWGEEYGSEILGRELPLGVYNYQVCENDQGIWWAGKREVSDPCARVLSWEIRVQASEDGEALLFVTDVDWDTANRRLRAVFPVDDRDSQEVLCGIPYGFIRRSYNSEAKHLPKYPPGPFAQTAGYERRSTSENGELAVHQWAKHEIDRERGAALLLKGLSCVRWLPGCLSVSLVRSPQMHDITILPHVQDIWDVDGMRETGHHRFEYGIYPYVKGLENGDLARRAAAYNLAVPEVPFTVDGDVVVTAFKDAEAGDGYIIRCYEAAGKGTQLRLRFDRARKVTPVNIVEDAVGETLAAEEYTTRLHKHEIFTVKVV